MKVSNIKQVIADTAIASGIVCTVAEAYVATPKKFAVAGESVSRETKRLHEELYENYIKRFNKNSAELDAIQLTDEDAHKKFRALKLDETFLQNMVHFHELYFSNSFDPKSEIHVDSLVYMRLERDWGSFERFQHDFIACSLVSRGGWAIVGFSQFLHRYMTAFFDSDLMTLPVGFFPVIVQDLHEHAYIRDFGNDKRTFVIEQMMQWNWDVIDERVQRAELIAEAIR